MREKLYGYLLILSFVFSVSAQKAQNQTSGASEENLRTHIGYLASDKLEGRRTGETGATYAAGYISNMFANYKLKANSSQSTSGKTKSNYLQTFPYVTGVQMADGNRFSLDVSKSDGQKMTFTEEMAFKPVGFSPNAEIGDTEIVFVGYGIASDELKYDDYKNLNINGRIVAAFDGTPEPDSPHSPWARFDARAKARIAKEKGAIALLLISREAKLENDKLAQLNYDATLGDAALPTLLVSRKTGADILAIDESGLKSAEEKIIAQTKSATPTETTVNQTLKTRAVASFKVNLTRTVADAYNVVGILEGSDPVLKNEAIIIGAHYDHLGKGGAGSLAINSKEIHHGADDNASGVSALLELARQFSQTKKNKRTIVFVAFGGEEEGLLGSKFYTNNPAFSINKTVAMINLDMVGRLQNDQEGFGKLTIGGIGTANEWRELVLRIAVNLPTLGMFSNPKTSEKNALENSTAPVLLTVPIKPIEKGINPQLNEDGFGPSDHSSFYAQKIPVLFFFTGTHADYHKPSDTAEKINYAGLLKITNYVGEIVKAIDENSAKPTYAVAKSSGAMGGRTGFNVSLGTVPSYSESTDGMTIDAVRDASPAQKAGLKAGDKIVKLAGKEIRNVYDYTFVLGEMKANVEYEVEVMRGSEKLRLKIVPAAAARR